jgi:signal transduction histidine kinase
LIKLKEKKELKRKESLIRFLCHEIRSPLNIIQTGLNLLQSSEHYNQESEVIIDMSSECGAAINILNSLLENEKIESMGSINIRCSYVDCSCITSAFERYKLIAKVASINYEVVCELNKTSNDYVLYIDLHKIEQVIRNLITNAVKYTSKGGLVTVTMKVCDASSQYTRLLWLFIVL